MKDKINYQELFTNMQDDITKFLLGNNRKTIDKSELQTIADKYLDVANPRTKVQYTMSKGNLQLRVPNDIKTCQKLCGDALLMCLVLERHIYKAKQAIKNIQEQALTTEMDYCKALEEYSQQLEVLNGNLSNN